MSWTTEQWTTFVTLLEHGWPGEFSTTAQKAWRVMLDDVDPAPAVVGLKKCIKRGGTFRPSVAEVVAAALPSNGGPSFDEAWPQIEDAMRRNVGNTDRMIEAVREKVGDVAAGWIVSYGPQRLMMEPVYDPDHGGAVLHRLRQHFAEVTSSEHGRHRLLTTLTSGGRSRIDGPRKIMALEKGI